jgi:RNA ligase
MKTLKIQEQLRSGKDTSSFEKEPYFLSVKQHSKYPELFQFTYNTIYSPRGDELVNQCRGLILNASDNWNVVAYPFNRFFNDGEFYADIIDWSTARVQEKVDGTLIIMYFYGNCWQIATRGSPDASGPVGDYPWIENGVSVELTFKRLFWHSIEYWLKGLSKSGEFDINYTYMWELTSPYNRIVCDYTEVGPIGKCVDGFGNEFILDSDDDLIDMTGYASDGSRVTLIGIRDNITGQEIDINSYRDDVHYVVQEFPLSTLEEVIQAASKLNPLKQEGYVVVDKDFHRIKIKSPAYVAIHHLRDGNPRKRLMEIIQSGESEEMLAYKILDEWPTEKHLYLEMKEKVDKLIFQTQEIYDTIKNIEIQKDFALAALKFPMSSAMFSLRKGSVTSIRQFIMKMQPDKLLDIIDKL